MAQSILPKVVRNVLPVGSSDWRGCYEEATRKIDQAEAICRMLATHSELQKYLTDTAAGVSDLLFTARSYLDSWYAINLAGAADCAPTSKKRSAVQS